MRALLLLLALASGVFAAEELTSNAACGSGGLGEFGCAVGGAGVVDKMFSLRAGSEPQAWKIRIDTMTSNNNTRPCRNFKKGAVPRAHTQALLQLLVDEEGESYVDSISFTCSMPGCGSVATSRRLRAIITTKPMNSSRADALASAFLTNHYKNGGYSQAVMDAGIPLRWAPNTFLYLHWAELAGKSYCSWWPVCVVDLWHCPEDAEESKRDSSGEQGGRTWRPDFAIRPTTSLQSV